MMIYFSISLGIAICYITLELLLKDQQKVKQIPHTFTKYWISHKVQQLSKPKYSKFLFIPSFLNVCGFSTVEATACPAQFQVTGAAFNGSDT